MAAFLVAISTVAVLPAVTVVAPPESADDILRLDEQSIGRLEPPDPPPPRL